MQFVVSSQSYAATFLNISWTLLRCATHVGVFPTLAGLLWKPCNKRFVPSLPHQQFHAENKFESPTSGCVAQKAYVAL